MGKPPESQVKGLAIVLKRFWGRMKAEIHGSLDQLSFQSSLNWKNNGSRRWRECSWGSFFLFEMLMMVFHLSCFMFHVVKGFTPFLLISLYLYLAVCGPVYTILGKNSWLSIAVDKTTVKKIGFLESTRTNLKITWKWSGNITTWRSRQPEGGNKYSYVVLVLCVYATSSMFRATWILSPT